jgi:hypothetical protein
MQNIKIFYSHTAKFHKDILDSFNVPLDVPMIDLREGYQPCDVLVTYGIDKLSRHRGRLIREIWKEHTGRKLIVELGFVKRRTYYSVGWDGMNGNADFMNDNSPSDRWDELEVEFNNLSGGDNIVVIGQIVDDAKVQHINFNKWCSEMIESVKFYGNVVYRPSPYDTTGMFANTFVGDGCNFVSSDVPISCNKSFKEELMDTKVCVIFNSTCGIESIIEGIPVFAFSEDSMVYGLANHNINMIDDPYFPTMEVRKQWAYNLAYAQWTKDEISMGLPHRQLGLI